MDRNKVYLEVPKFTGKNVPISVAARIMRSAVYPPRHYPWASEIRSSLQERGKFPV